MNLSIGIVGLPNVGKSTLFNALTRASVPTENYPFCTIDPSVGVVAVPDERFQKLSNFSKSVKTIPAVLEFVDIAGLVEGASEGQGLGNQFLSNIREASAVAHVVRIFEDENIIHVDGKIDPLSDIEIINLELALSDLQTVSKRSASIEKEVKRRDKNALMERSALSKLEEVLEGGRPAAEADLDEQGTALTKQLSLLTAKPILYVLNRKAGGRNLDEIKDWRWKKLMDFFERTGSRYVIVDAGFESELRDLSAEEKREFRRGVAGKDDGVNNLIKAGYELLGLITFFTTGEKESRAWTVKKGAAAPAAGAAIHTDFRQRFIRAEVIGWDKLLAAGSYARARELGLVRTEGKEYIVKDGDVIEFKI